MGFRQYDAPSGRFLSRDPILSLNPYWYGDGDPVSSADPWGLEPLFWFWEHLPPSIRGRVDRGQFGWSPGARADLRELSDVLPPELIHLYEFGVRDIAREAQTPIAWYVDMEGGRFIGVIGGLAGASRGAPTHLSGTAGQPKFVWIGGSRGFKNMRAFKKVFGKASRYGDDFVWHHIVEQRKVGKFGRYRIHNTDNLVALPRRIHDKISGHYNSRPRPGGSRIRDTVSEWSFEEQWEYGREILHRYSDPCNW
jgi:hypothetical protein